MILELDCGNSLVKWRIIPGEGKGSVESGVAETFDLLLDALAGVAEGVVAGRMVSVRSDEETRLLVSRLEDELGVSCTLALPATKLGRVTNGYQDYARLGLDRWLAVVAAYESSGKACVVIDLGTAVTVDFVDLNGCHLGGYICPGLPLLRSQLQTHTRRIRYGHDDCSRALANMLPGRTTAEAVERGCLLMLRGFVREQLSYANELLGVDYVVFLTGGDAGLVAADVPGAFVVPDLVFHGLGLACPLAGEGAA